MDGIHPKPKMGKNENVHLTWVPVADSLYEKIENNFVPNSLNFIEGLYVARLAVKPKLGHITYYWNQD